MRAPWKRRGESRDTDGITLKSPTEAFVRDLGKFFGGGESFSGKSVTPVSAMEGTIAVFACVGIIADAVSTLPLLLYKSNPDDTRTRVPSSDPLVRLLHRAPNPELTSQEFFESVAGHNLLWGNHYSFIERTAAGAAAELWPMRPDRMNVVLIARDGTVFSPDDIDPAKASGLRRVYVYQLPSGELTALNRENVLHVRGLGMNPYVGMAPATVFRNAVGIEQAAQEFTGRFYKNGTVLGSILKIPQAPGTRKLDPDDKKKIRDEFSRLHGGVSKSHRLAILEGGVEWQQVGMPLADAQFIETRKFQITEIARMYRIPPHLVGDVERSTSWGTGIEEQSLAFLTHTLRPWLERIEQAVDRDLGAGRGGQSLSDRGLIAEFLVEGLLRTDIKTRFEAYEIAIRNRVITPNFVARKENLPVLEGGDEPLVSVNLQTQAQADAALTRQADAPAAAPAARSRRFVRDEHGRIAGVEEE